MRMKLPDFYFWLNELGAYFEEVAAEVKKRKRG